MGQEPQRLTRPRYRSFIFDSARWEDFELRGDDVIVTTPAKTGTTWLQTICVLLIHGPPPWGRSLADISPWLDMNVEPAPDVHDRLAAQTHRRVIKTHTPLDGLPHRSGVRYLGVGRDPRDVGLSWDGHVQNTDVENTIEARLRAVGGDDLGELPNDGGGKESDDPADRFLAFVDNEHLALQGGSLLGLTHHIAQLWHARHRDDVLLLHYADLKADLGGQMRRIADFLDIDVDEAQWPALVDAAGLDAMRRRAEELAPAVDAGIWQNTRAFFAQGRLGGWRDLPADVLAHYDHRMGELVPAPLHSWLEREVPGPVQPGRR